MTAVPAAADRAALVMGAASVFSSVFALTKGDPWQLVKMPGGAVPVALALGAAAILAGWRRRSAAAVATGGGFLIAAFAVLLELALDAGWLGSSASTLSLWAGLGIGLVATGLAPRDT